ncbi:MAG: TRAM domain-containing protein, partial [Methanobacteriaceae archaeon]|nr:TRAM domain-containing protein [Methanobacteriaceae archaeon]
IPEISIATDIIVGYPTEDEAAFEDTCDLIKDIKPNFIHLSKYKHRHRTESSALEEIHFTELKRRSKFIEGIKTDITRKDNQKLIGTTQEVLVVEKGRKGGFIGRTNSYMPVVVQDAEVGSFKIVKITEATSTYLRAS